MDLERREHRLTEREERLDAESRHLEEQARALADHQPRSTPARPSSTGSPPTGSTCLERAAGLTAEGGPGRAGRHDRAEARRDAGLLVRDIEQSADREGELRARRIVTGAIQRLATEQTSESVVSVLHLPSDDMKGRIIGREGRNIRTFEAVTGVNLIIDDTPEAVLLSCFDPVRREVGRITLEALVLDGRIHPQRIEDAYERARAEVEALLPARGGGRPRRGRHHRDASRAGRHARPAALPHVVRAERAQAPASSRRTSPGMMAASSGSTRP